MIALLDGDILLYEVGWCCQGVDKETGEEYINAFEFGRELIDNKIEEILRRSNSTDLAVFLTGPNNFREAVAKRKGYKEGRKELKKPFHYNNLKQYLITQYNAIVTQGIEADDAICITQSEMLKEGKESVICSRDKDLRQCQGWFYSWECGQQPEFGPKLIEGFGELTITLYPEDHKLAGKLKKLVGTGDKWFLTQLLMGDPVDNIPGLPQIGPVKAYEIMEPIDNYEDGLNAIITEYQRVFDTNWRTELEEQAQLVYMLRERNTDGSPKMWRLDG